MAKREKTGGRTTGTPNKVTAEMRKQLKVILDDEVQKIPDLLNELEDSEKRLMYILKLMPFVFPKVSSVTLNDGEPLTLDLW